MPVLLVEVSRSRHITTTTVIATIIIANVIVVVLPIAADVARNIAMGVTRSLAGIYSKHLLADFTP